MIATQRTVSLEDGDVPRDVTDRDEPAARALPTALHPAALRAALSVAAGGAVAQPLGAREAPTIRGVPPGGAWVMVVYCIVLQCVVL